MAITEYYNVSGINRLYSLVVLSPNCLEQSLVAIDHYSELELIVMRETNCSDQRAVVAAAGLIDSSCQDLEPDPAGAVGFATM